MILTGFLAGAYLSGQYILDNFPGYEYNGSGTILLASHNYKENGKKIISIKKNDIIKYQGVEYKIYKKEFTKQTKYKLEDILKGGIVLQSCSNVSGNIYLLFGIKNVPKKENSN